MGGGESSESVYVRCGSSICANELDCGVVEWVKRNTLKWFGHVERMESKELKKVYEGELEGPNRRGRPLGRWKDRVEEYWGEKGINVRGVEARKECCIRERWRLLCCAHPLRPMGTYHKGVRHQRQTDIYTLQSSPHLPHSRGIP